jgi:glycosyltransferase involved in cell wall biosynthesis
MKVVHLVAYQTGGAARAAERISMALQKAGVESSIILKKDLHNRKGQRILRIANIFTRKLLSFITDNGASPDLLGMNLSLVPELKEADIIQLHWVDDGMLGRNSIQSLIDLGKPVVWTLHDMRPFTGMCHYNRGCKKYVAGCTECPDIRIKSDFAFKNQKIVKSLLEHNPNTIVGCSRWMVYCASESFPMKKCNCINIPNCIDTEVFFAEEQAIAQKKLGIDTQKKIILFGAVDSTSDPRKGFKYIQELSNLIDTSRFVFAVFGGDASGVNGCEILQLGNIHDDDKLRALYSAADVYVAPSVQENLANTVMESLACGTPVTAFDIGVWEI